MSISHPKDTWNVPTHHSQVNTRKTTQPSNIKQKGDKRKNNRQKKNNNWKGTKPYPTNNDHINEEGGEKKSLIHALLAKLTIPIMYLISWRMCINTFLSVEIHIHLMFPLIPLLKTTKIG